MNAKSAPAGPPPGRSPDRESHPFGQCESGPGFERRSRAPRRPRSQQKALTRLDIRNRPPGLHQDGEVAGLYLRVTDSGARGFLLRFMLAGRRRDLWIGSTSEFDLTQAREEARRFRQDIKNGIDPVERRQLVRRQNRLEQAIAEWTFERAAREVHATLKPGWKNPKHADQWINTLVTYVFPRLGNRAVGAVDVAGVVEVLKPIWTAKAETARRVRQRIDQVMRWAVAHEYATANPTDSAVELLPKQGDRVAHHEALPAAEAPAFVARLRASAALSCRALEFLILTAARSGEVRGATWSEIDFEAATWTVPAARMKAKAEHVVPLPEAAVALLRALAKEGAVEPDKSPDDLIFKSPTGRKLSDNAFTALLLRMSVEATAHGFRSSFRDWCSENEVPREVAERALAHVVADNVEAAYLRTKLIEQRREVMARWASFLGGAA
jgi:integrase